MSEDSSPDVYVRQLREIFLACDSSGSGLLNRDDLQRLCRRLNLESEINKRITDSLCVAGDDRRRCVGFDEFKETFINVLTESEHKATNDGRDVTSSAGHMGSDGLENAVDLSEEERHLLGIWKELGVGANGNLNINELHQVCQFLNMNHMTNKDVEQLFAKLDVDGDGFVSFGELLHGLFEIGEISHADEELPAKRNAFPAIDDKRRMSLPLQHSYDRRSVAAQSSHSPLHAHEGILAFLKKEGSGFAKPETIVELWESVGIKEGHLILKLLRFDTKKSISLLDLSLSLVDEIHAIEVDNNIVYEAALSTVEHALDYLHSVNEDLKLERDRLISDLSTMKKRNAAIVEEFDEQLYSSAEAQKAQDQQLAAVEIANKYQQVLTQLKQESNDCDQLRSNLIATKEEVNFLVEKLRLTNKAKDALELELSHMSKKCWSLENELEERDVEQKELEKKELDNRLQQNQVRETERGSVVVDDNHESELEHLMRGMSVERKDIEGAFRMEIAELEQRHLDELNALKKELEKEKDDLVSGHKRHLAEAVAERERDLLTEFAKEMSESAPQHHSADSTEFKQMHDRLRLAQEMAEERSRYAKELETELFALQKKRDERRLPDAVQRQHQLKDEDEEDEDVMDSSRDEERRLMEKLKEEKQRMAEKFHEDIAAIHQEHKQDLTKLSNDLTQGFHLERDKAEASFADERRRLENKITSIENDLLTMEEDMERYKEDMEKELQKKDLERELYRKDFEEQLQLKELEKEHHVMGLEHDLMKKDEEIELFKKELEKQQHKKELEKDVYRTELEQVPRIKEDEKELLKNEMEEQLRLKDLEKEQHIIKLEQDLRKNEEEKELLRNELEKQQLRKESEKDVYRAELEQDLRIKEDEKELLKSELEEQLRLKELEKEQRTMGLERDLMKKDEEIELFKKELEKQQRKKELEKDVYRTEIEQGLRKNEEEKELLKNEMEEQLQLKDLEKEQHIIKLEQDLRKNEEEKELLKNELEKQQRKKESEKDVYRTELEQDLRIKEEEKELLKNELEEQLRLKELEKDLYYMELEKERRKKEVEQELHKKELERELTRKDEENENLRSEISKLKRLKDEIELERTRSTEEERSHERTADGYLKLQVDELRRNNVRLKDSLEKRDGELLRLRQELERSHRQLKRDHLTGSGDHQLMTNSVAMSNLRDVLVERDLLKKQLQLTVNQLSEAASTLSLLSEELKKEKEMATKVRGQMVERSKYDDVIVRLRDAHAKVHHLQHDHDFRAAETTKLLSLSQTVNKQRLNKLMDENEKLETQMKQRKTLIKDQLMKITKQADELLKSDALIRDLYIENAHLIRCLQRTEGNRQDSDMKVQVLHQKCIDLGRLLSTVGPLAFNHH